MPNPLPARKRGALRVLRDALRGAREHTPMRQLSSYAKPWSVRRFCLRFVLLCELLRELRSVGRRIAEMHSRAEDEQGYELTLPEWVSNLMRGELLLAHSADIRNLQSRYPWLAAFDVGLHLEGFAAGALWQLRTSCLDREEEKTDRPPKPPYWERHSDANPKSSI